MIFKDIRHEVLQYKSAQDIVRINAVVDDLMQAGQNVAFERGRSAVMLSSPNTASIDNLQFIAERRTQADMRMQKVLQNKAILELPSGERLKRQYETIRTLRKENDTAFLVPYNQRDQRLSNRWTTAASAFISEINAAALSISLAKESYAVSFRNLSRLKFHAFELRNLAGSESSLIAIQLIKNIPLDYETSTLLMRLRGQSGAVWNGLKCDTLLSGNQAAADAAEHINQSFFVEYRCLLDAVLSDLDNGHEGRITISELSQASVPALNSIAQLMSVLTIETAAEITRIKRSATLALLFSVLFGFFSLLIGIMLLLSFSIRFLLPLKTINDNLLALAAGNTSIKELKKTRTNNEMLCVNDAITVFRDSIIQQKELEARLRKMSSSDGLTGLANRRSMNETLQEEWNRALRSGTPIGAAIFDVDFFKKYNDSYGHLAGDECLKKIASVFTAHTQRPGDMASRFGGEEFFILLPGLSYEQVFHWAEQVRVYIQNLQIPHTDSATGFVTISCGVSSLIPSNDSSPLELIRLADERLYRAKAQGRNRVAGK